MLDMVPSEKLTELCTLSVPPAALVSIDLVARIVDDIGVVAEAAVHGVGADAAVEHVGADIAGEDVGTAVAGAVDVAEPARVRFSTSRRA